MTIEIGPPDAAASSEVPSPPAIHRAIRSRLLPGVAGGVLMLGFGLAGASRPELSWDEIATADVARRPVVQIWHLLHHIDGVFGPYYLLMHLWTTVLGDSVLALRLPSILAMAAAVAAAGELGRRAFGETVGIVAVVLLCLMPNTSRYAAEARPYGFACLFATLALLLLHRALNDSRARRWCAYGAAVFCMGLSHLLVLAALPAHAAICALRLRRRPWRRPTLAWGASVAAALLALSPLLWWGMHQRQEQLHWVKPLTLGALCSFPARFVGTPETAWALIGLALYAASRLGRRSAETAVAAAVPLLVVGTVSAVGPSFWVIRYVLYVLMPTAVLAAAGLVHACAGLRPRRVGARIVAALVVVAVAAAPGQLTVRGPTVKNGSDYRTLAGIIRRRQAVGDVIVYQAGSRTLRPGVGYYLRTDAGAPRDVLMRQTAAQAAALIAQEYRDPVARLAAANRIWLVVAARRGDPVNARRDLARLLHAQYRRAGLWRVKRATMALYVHRRVNRR
ncbi:glycosyltransferase family 39 protein [Actinoplanes sp. NPDC051475]|uniref:glycosyltransferase family 39 protein n=1 Tax=Actinoplanes sp. NPDC051475 TaxID=3157225 RepID=UPI00344ED2B4